MMGWLVILLLALAVVAGLWRFIARDAGAMQFLGAALLLALAGYAWQGRPALAGAPKPSVVRQQGAADTAFANLRPELMGRFNNAAAWLTMAESYQRSGDTQSGVDIIRSALRQSPQNADLWVGLGNALVLHGDGLMSPAAEIAFNKASQIAPDHPGPRFFYGLALAQGGRYDEAEQTWRTLLASAPAGATWRGAIEQQLQALAAARASGQLAPPLR